jgi:hypothetical protein
MVRNFTFCDFTFCDYTCRDVHLGVIGRYGGFVFAE